MTTSRDWIRKFLDEGKEIMGMDCSGLVRFIVEARKEGAAARETEIREGLQGLRRKIPKDCASERGSKGCVSCSEMRGFNRALDAALSLINDKKGDAPQEEKGCCQWCLKGGDYQMRSCKKCLCHQPKE